MYTYQVEFVNEDYEVLKQSGIVNANSYTDAMTRLSSYYGENAIVTVHNLTELEDSPIVLPHKVCKKIQKEEYFNEYDK